MNAVWHRQFRKWSSWPDIEFKFYLAFSNWVYMEMFSRFLLMIIVTSFWRAVYENDTTLSGMTLQQTLNYILIANLFGGFVMNSIVFDLGFSIREGQIIMEMLRPVDFQLAQFVRIFSRNLIGLFVNIPMIFLAIILFGLRLPTDPMVWGSFIVSIVLGQTVVFLFDWIISCAIFYTNEAWGLGVMREGIALFLAGLVVPFSMMPDWLQTLASFVPFAQAGVVPVSILSGSLPLSDVPRAWLVQFTWAVALLFLSRAVFSITSRKVTVQGG